MSNQILYIGFVVADSNDEDFDEKQLKVIEYSQEELGEKIADLTGYEIDQAFVGYPPQVINEKTRLIEFKKEVDITDIMRSTVQIKRLNKRG